MYFMNDSAIPVLVEEEEATTQVPRETMAELVFGDACCRVCTDRGTEHVPEDDTYYPGQWTDEPTQLGGWDIEPPAYVSIEVRS